MTTEQTRDWQYHLSQLGWVFCPISDTEWTWLKFDNTDRCIAQQGDTTWAKDMEDFKND